MCHEKGILLESANLFSLSFIDDDLQNTGQLVKGTWLRNRCTLERYFTMGHVVSAKSNHKYKHKLVLCLAAGRYRIFTYIEFRCLSCLINRCWCSFHSDGVTLPTNC